MGVSLIRLLSVAMEFFVGIDEAFFALQWTYLSRMRLPTKQTYFAWGFLAVGVLSISHFLSLPYDSITERQPLVGPDIWREGFPEAGWRGVRTVILSSGLSS
jgi:hypothetical protein